MTHLLEEVLAKVSKLPSEEQDALAGWLLKELESESRWQELFAESQDVLSQLGTDALAERREGCTENLDPDRI